MAMLPMLLAFILVQRKVYSGNRDDRIQVVDALETGRRPVLQHQDVKSVLPRRP